MSTDVLVRRVEPDDLAGVVALAGSRQRAESRLGAAARDDEAMFVAVRSGRVLGVVSIRWAGGCDPPHPWMYGLHVADDARRQGLGRTLVRTAEALARHRGADHMALDVDDDEAGAIAFYERLGYAVVGPHRHHWRSVDVRTGTVTAEGVSPTFVMRGAL